MTVSFFYSISETFSESGVEIGQLQGELISNSLPINHINTVDDEMELIFDRELTEGEDITLGNVLNNHVPEILYSQYFCPYSSDTNIVSADYKNVVSFNFPTQLGIKKIEVVANIPGTATSYDLRILDITHNNIMFTGNYANIGSQILVLSSLTNIPLSSSFISVQVRVNGGDNTVLINNISVFM